MKKFLQESSLYTVLFVAFIDLMGVGLIYPLFSTMLFDLDHPLLPLDTSQHIRGLWLGILLALMPLAQFFSAPVWGALSDSKGRRDPLRKSLYITFFGYILGVLAIHFTSLGLLLLSRLIIGFASGNMAIVEAIISDSSDSKNKAKNFGLYGMASGAGFTLGPFFGGILGSINYASPFIFASCLALGNIIFAHLFVKETHFKWFKAKLTWHMALTQFKKAFRMSGVRAILSASFLHNFGWCFFFEFIPVYLIIHYQFSTVKLGAFFGLSGAFYALGTGLLIRPFVTRFKPEVLFFAGNLLTALTIFLLLIIPSSLWIWPLIVLFCFFISFVYPTSATIISNNVSSQIQGEALGLLSSVNALALILSPIFSGSIVGKYPTLPMYVGGSVMLGAALVVLLSYRSKLIK